MWISQSEAAKLPQVKVSKQRINALVREGRLGTNERKQVKLQDVITLFQQGRDPAWTDSPLSAAAVRPDAPAGEDEQESLNFREVRTQRESIQVEAAQFELDVKKGKYLPKQEVLDAMVSSGRNIRQMLDAVTEWADELAAIAAGGPMEVRRLLKAKLRALEQQVADAISLRGGDEDDEQGYAGDRPAH